MRRALHSTTDGSDKFWRIRTHGPALAVFWGRTGTIGRLTIKEHHDDAACLAAATALADAKVRKGYVELDEEATAAAFDDHLYLDGDELGPHQLTSHPRFLAHFRGDLWYDPMDEEAPFGNDSGSDAMSTLTDHVRSKGPEGALGDLPRAIVQDAWDMRYVPPAPLTDAEADLAVATRSSDGLPASLDLCQSDQVTVALAFGAAKIYGRVDPELRERALLALERLQVVGAAESRAAGQDAGRSAELDEIAQALRTFPG